MKPATNNSVKGGGRISLCGLPYTGMIGQKEIEFALQLEFEERRDIVWVDEEAPANSLHSSCSAIPHSYYHSYPYI